MSTPHISSPLQHAVYPDSPVLSPIQMDANVPAINTPAEESQLSEAMPVNYHENPISSGSGITVMLALAEPMLFLEGFDRGDSSSRKTCLLRGYLRIRVVKAAKIKKIYLNFRGASQTHWPEGVPPKKQTTVDAISLMNHTWTFFNAQFAHAEHSYCADRVVLQGRTPATELNRPIPEELFHTRADSPNPLSTSTAAEIKRKSLQPGTRPRSISRGEGGGYVGSVAQHGYKVFYPGEYIYNFELPIDSKMPETIKTETASVKYELESIIERSGAFRPNLLGRMEVPFIRTPSETSLEHVEPIAISRTWEDQLHYDIVISGKLFPMGARVPIAFKFTPLSKVHLHRIKVYLTEHTQIFTSNRQCHRLDNSKKILLLDKRAGHRSTSAYPGSTMRVNAGAGLSYDQRMQLGEINAGEEPVDDGCTNLLGDLHPDLETGPTEYEFNMQLPICHLNKAKPPSQRMHFDTTYENIEINHWIKVVLRLSKADAQDPAKWKHFEISIDSPFHLLSCLASRSNTALPAYSRPNPIVQIKKMASECNCEGALADQLSEGDHSYHWNSADATSRHDCLPTSLPSNGHTQDEMAMRPIHLIRAPSFGPPPFDSITPPPPDMLVSPPPAYGSIFNSSENPYEDYFARLQIARKENDYEARYRRSSRVDIPLTPGGRINRSMDEPREWVGVGDEESALQS
ncbi:hypothetical protein KEM54_005393 [Ascosphaera aggregata]|nr:hypothetical protein KEM54_005393 [Ascosphaera aggregata]